MKRFNRALPFRVCVLACATALPAAPAQAQFSTDGYLRAGTGAGVKGDSNACFRLGSNFTNQSNEGLNYRLGNECDTYVEVNLKNTIKAGEVQFSANIMPTYFANSQDNADSTGLGQAFVEGRGFDVAPDVNFWAGKRYYGRSDVHITDTKYTKLDGTGAGADNIAAGPGKLAIGYFRRDFGPSSRLNADWQGIPANADGWLRFLLTLTDAETDGAGGAPGTGVSGKGFTVTHYQHGLLGLGGGNTVYVQYADGSAGLDGNFGNILGRNGSTDQVKSRRIVDAFTWQVDAFSGQGTAMIQNTFDGWGDVKTESAGARVAYAFTTHFKLVAEAGYSKRTLYWDTAQPEKLAKFTIAPTLSSGRGLQDRPELRLFFTRGKWNAAAAANALNGELPAGRTSANRYGVQAEVWW
jgi:maltoporin